MKQFKQLTISIVFALSVVLLAQPLSYAQTAVEPTSDAQSLEATESAEGTREGEINSEPKTESKRQPEGVSPESQQEESQNPKAADSEVDSDQGKALDEGQSKTKTEATVKAEQADEIEHEVSLDKEANDSVTAQEEEAKSEPKVEVELQSLQERAVPLKNLQNEEKEEKSEQLRAPLLMSSSNKNQLFEFYAKSNVVHYKSPSLSAKKMKTNFPKGSSGQAVQYDAAGEWFYASVNQPSQGTIVYFHKSQIELIPSWDAADRTVKTFMVDPGQNKSVPYYSVATTSSKNLGSFKPGQVVKAALYSEDGTWATVVIGGKRVFLKSALLKPIAPHNAKDKAAHLATLTAPKSYYNMPGDGAKELGSWPAGTIVGYIHWDSNGKWYTASMGPTTIYFKSDNMQKLPDNNAQDKKAYSGLTAGKVTYYQHPSKNAKVLGSWPNQTKVGYMKWDQSDRWYWAWMGKQKVFFEAASIIQPVNSAEVFSGLSLTEVPYYNAPNTNAKKIGTFPAKTPLGYVRYDVQNTWYTATMGVKGRIYFKAQDIETLPKKTATNQQARTGVASEKITYYQAPSTNAKALGSFKPGTVFGYVPWDKAGKWYWATMGKQVIYFKVEGQTIKQDATDKSVYAGYALENVNYYAGPHENSPRLGTFKKGTYLGFLHFDARGQWGWASMGAQKVYFPIKNVAKVPKVLSKDKKAFNGKTKRELTYYAAPTTASQKIGTWAKGTNIGFVKYDTSGTWYWANMGPQKVYFQANGVEKIVTPTDVANVLKGELGTVGGSKYLKAAYGPNYHVPWCAIYQWWGFNEAGVPLLFNGGRPEADPVKIHAYYTAQGQIVTDPKPGDLVFISSTGRYSHIAYILSVSGNKATIIEGNWGNKVITRTITITEPGTATRNSSGTFARPRWNH